MSADNASLWSLLTSFTNPDPQVQNATLSAITHLSQTWAQMPYVLAEFLAHGSAGATSAEEQSAGQQAAGTVLKQQMNARLSAVKEMAEGKTPAVQYPQLDLASFDVPLLFAICSGDKKIQLASSSSLSLLVQYANEVAKMMAKNNADGAAAASTWITSLIAKLEQLVQADNVTNNHLGVSRCLGVLMEDRTQELLSETRQAAVAGNDTEEYASAALVQRLEHMTRFIVPVYRLLAFLVSNSNSYPAKLNALSCVAGITFVLGEPGLTGDSDDEDGELAVKGVSPTRSVKFAGQDAKAARAQMANEMYKAEKHLVSAVVQYLPTVVSESLNNCDVSNEEGVTKLLDGLTTALKALTSVSSHWALVQEISLAVLPTVLQWLAVFDWRQQAAKVAAIGHLVIDPSILRNCSFETEELRICCLDFITELAQQIEENDDVCNALTQHHVGILQQLYAASVLDEMAVSEITIEADRHVPDSMQDILFAGKKKNKGGDGNGTNEEADDELLDDGADDDTNIFRCTSPSRTSAMFCFSAIALILPPAFVFAVMDMLHPVVQKHLASTEGAQSQQNPDWLELEGALAFLAEALTNGATTGDDDSDDVKGRMSAVAEQVAVICCRFLGIGQNSDGTFGTVQAHFAGPVRAAAALILARIGERLVYDNDPEEASDSNPQELAEYVAKTNRQNLILDTIVSVLYHTAVHDQNKAALRAATSSYATIIQHSFVAQADDEDDFDGDDDEEGNNNNNGSGPSVTTAADGSTIPCVHVDERHISNLYGLSTHLTTMPLSQRMVYYKLLPDICKADVEVMKRSSIFLKAVEPVINAILAAWKQLVTSLDTYESLALGDLVYEILQSLSKDEPYRSLPASCARTLWADIGVTVFQTSGLAQNLMNGVDVNGLTTETVSMATDVLSQLCDATETAVTAELFHTTGIASVIANIVLPILTRGGAAAAEAHKDKSKSSHATEELTRAALGLLGDFCGIVTAEQVHSVADALVAPIAHVLTQEAGKINNGSLTLSADGKSVTKTYKGGLKVTSVGGADLSDLFGDDDDESNERVMLGNALFCLAKLLESVSTGDELLRVCPTALPDPAKLQALIGACTVLLKLLGGGASGVTKLNLLIVTAKFGSLFPTILDGVGGAAVILSEAKTLACVDDISEQLDVALSIGTYFTNSPAVQQRAQELRARGLILSLALAVAPALKKCMTAASKGDAEAISSEAVAKAQKVHAMWAPMVSMCQDAVASAPSAKFSTTMKSAEKKLMQTVYFS